MDITLGILKTLVAEAHVDASTLEGIVKLIGKATYTNDTPDYDARAAYVQQVLHNPEAAISGFTSSGN